MASKNSYSRYLPTVKNKKSMKGIARRASWTVKVKGVDVTKEIKNDLISMELTDNEEGSADDFQLKLADREGKWLQEWLNESVQKGSKANGLTFDVKIGLQDSTGKVYQQKSGSFQLDSMKHSGPPGVATIKCTSLDLSGSIRSEKRSKSWEKYDLGRIAKEIADKGKLKLLFNVQKKNNPYYERKEQDEETDMAFLLRLCDAAGVFVKIYKKKMIIFEKGPLEKKNPVMNITFKDGSYTKWDLDTSSGDVTYDYCTVKYTNPKTGTCIEGTYKSQAWYDEEEEDSPSHTGLILKNKKVKSVGEAESIAEQELNLRNLFERNVTLTLPGNPMLMAGLPVRLKKFGYWTGKYMISKCVHSISSSGYTTKLTLRMILDGETKKTESNSGSDGSGSGGDGGSGGSNNGYYARVYYTLGSGASSSVVGYSKVSYADALKIAYKKVPSNAHWAGTTPP